MNSTLMFLHGLESTGCGFKATYLRTYFPKIITPTFTGNLDERMQQLERLIPPYSRWIFIGSSFGGLMATLFAIRHPKQISKLILLAPALLPSISPSLSWNEKLSVPIVGILAKHDTLLPLKELQRKCESIFRSYWLHIVEDEHKLEYTTKMINWKALVFQSHFRFMD